MIDEDSIKTRLTRIEDKLDQLLENKRGPQFVKPSPNDIMHYAEELGIEKPGEFADKFVNFYESKGWKVGKAPMKSWKAAVRTWQNKMGMKINKPTKEPEDQRRWAIIMDKIIFDAPSSLLWSDHILSQMLSLPKNWQELTYSKLDADQKHWFLETKNLRGK